MISYLLTISTVIYILARKRGSKSGGICPGCEIVFRPIFDDTVNVPSQYPTTTPESLAEAIIETVRAGVNVFNLSIGLSTSSLSKYQEIEDAYIFAFERGVIIIVAAGNQGDIGFFPILNHHWIIPVAVCDQNSRLHAISNIGPSIARRRVMAPGINITSTAPRGGYKQLSGTSFAVPFVTGTIVLLWSIFENARPDQLVRCIRYGGSLREQRSIYPPLCNATKSRETLGNLLSSIR